MGEEEETDWKRNKNFPMLSKWEGLEIIENGEEKNKRLLFFYRKFPRLFSVCPKCLS